MILEKQPTYIDDTEAVFRKTRNLSEVLHQCFYGSSRKDQLIEVVRESIETGVWFPCLQDLDNWSDWERFAALELLVAAVGLHYGVLNCSFLLPNFVQLRYWFYRSNAQLGQLKILLCS